MQLSKKSTPVRIAMLFVLSLLVTGQAMAQSTCTPPPAGLVSWWPGDGNTGDIADFNPGTLLNGATFAPGKVGQGFSLDGINDTVQIAPNSNLKPSTQITIDAWIKLGSNTIITTLREIFRKEDGNDRILLSFQPGGYCFNGGLANFSFPGVTGTPPCLAFGFSTASNGYKEFEVGGVDALADGNFHHVAATYDGSARYIYIDGVLRGSVADSGAIGTTGTAPAYIGSVNGTSEFFHGLIDELDLFDRALSAAEIQAIFNAGAAGKCKPSGSLVVATLVNAVVALNLKAGISNSLDGKLDSALSALDDSNQQNNVAAINSMQAFINAVEAQRGVHITNADADALIAQAQAIIAVLGG